MQSCSVQHCVLFLLTLYTLTTDPGSATSRFPFYATLHRPVTLPCEAQCSGRGWWSLDSNRSDVFARCDQTSCTSVKDGYEMSYDQFKSGDLSLTITKPDYSMRKTYTCECGYSDYVTVNLKISTVFSPVPVQTEGDLKLDLSVTEPVEVIYRGSVLADDVQICTVTNRTLQCNTEYTPRTSLSYPELTLRHMERSESGTYTIRNLDYKEDIRVYAVSVSGLTRGETAGIVIVVLILLALMIAGLVYYMKRKAEREKEEAERKYREVKSGKKAVNELINQAMIRPTVEVMDELQRVEEKINDLELKYRDDSKHSGDVKQFCNSKREDLTLYRKMFGDAQPVTGEVKSNMVAVYKDINETLQRPEVEVMKELQRVEKEIKDLEQKYRDDRVHSGGVTLFCYSMREELRLYREVFITRNTSLQPVTQEVKTVMNEVNELIKKAEHSPKGEQEAVMQKVFQKITDVKLKYRRTAEYYCNVTRFCNTKREELHCCSVFYRTQNKTTERQRKEVEDEMDAVDDLIKEVLQEEKKEKELQDVEKKINDLEQKYTDLVAYCNKKREELELCSKIYRTHKESQQPDTKEVKSAMEAVYDIIRQNKHRAKNEVMEEIADLELKCSKNIDYYSSVVLFWDLKRRDIELCSKLGLIQLGFIWSTTEKEKEEVVKILNELKWRSDQNHTVTQVMLSRMCTCVSSSLDRINDSCRDQRDNLNKFNQQLSRGETDDRMIRDVEMHLKDLELWCIDKEYELEIYTEKLKQQRGGGGSYNVDPQTSCSKGGEGTPLLKVTTEQK